MTVEAMRAILKKLYNGAYKWCNKVNNMSDAQVQAVYFRMLKSGQLTSTRELLRLCSISSKFFKNIAENS